MIKLSENILTKEKIDGKYGTFEAYVVKGDSTKNIKDVLGQLGFKWYGPKMVWWMSAKNMTESIKTRLQSVGVSTGVTSPISPIPENTTAPRSYPKPEKTWTTENEKASAWYNFPVNKDIMTFEEDIPSKEKVYKAQIKIERTYQAGKLSTTYHETFSREHKGLPKYIFHVNIPELSLDYNITHQATQKWGTYKEEDYLVPVKENIIKILKDPTRKLQKSIAFKEEMGKRTPEYKDFLNKIGKRELHVSYPFIVVDEKYGGEFTLEIYDLGMDEKSYEAGLIPKLPDPSAPRPSTLGGYKEADIWNTYTIEDFHKKINEYLIKEREKIQKDLIKYLMSFPYLAEQKQEAFKDFERVKQYVLNKSSSGYAEEVLNEIKARGYIRPSLRGNKKSENGTEVQTQDENIKWIVDSKKIVNEAYGSNRFLSESPDYFFAVVAYYVHRKVRGIVSFTDMMLVDAMGRWLDIMNRYGAGFNFKEVMYSIEQIGDVIVQRVYGKKTREQMEEEFRQWFDGNTRSTGDRPLDNMNEVDGLSSFKEFAQRYGIDPEGIENNVVSIYRALAKKLHPDLVQDPNAKLEAEKAFKELQGIWDNVPQNFKTALTWYDLVITAYHKN